MAAKLLILALVAWGIWTTINSARGEFAKAELDLTVLSAPWLLLAGGVYLLGMLPMGVFWIVVLKSLGQKPQVAETLRAFYIGHLGKYVPGKAMVVVLRTGLIRSGRVDTTVAAVSVFIETLTMMAVGAFLAAVLVAVFYAHQTMLLVLALGLMVCAGGPTIPPLFRRIVRLLKVRKANPEIENALGGLTARVMAFGWIANLIGWSLLGLSLWATLRAMPVELLGDGAQKLAVFSEVFPLVTATVCLAMVAGFLSLLPGGVGVREWVLLTTLARDFGPVAALVSAVLLRVVWLASELLLAFVLYVSVRSPKTKELGTP